MTTHPLTRPTSAEQKRLRAERDRAAVALPPNPKAWLAFLCRRCGTAFKVQGIIARHCVGCIHAAAAAGISGVESIGEMSGT